MCYTRSLFPVGIVCVKIEAYKECTHFACEFVGCSEQLADHSSCLETSFGNFSEVNSDAQK